MHSNPAFFWFNCFGPQYPYWERLKNTPRPRMALQHAPPLVLFLSIPNPQPVLQSQGAVYKWTDVGGSTLPMVVSSNHPSSVQAWATGSFFVMIPWVQASQEAKDCRHPACKLISLERGKTFSGRAPKGTPSSGALCPLLLTSSQANLLWRQLSFHSSL